MSGNNMLKLRDRPPILIKQFDSIYSRTRVRIYWFAIIYLFTVQTGFVPSRGSFCVTRYIPYLIFRSGNQIFFCSRYPFRVSVEQWCTMGTPTWLSIKMPRPITKLYDTFYNLHVNYNFGEVSRSQIWVILFLNLRILTWRWLDFSWKWYIQSRSSNLSKSFSHFLNKSRLLSGTLKKFYCMKYTIVAR